MTNLQGNVQQLEGRINNQILGVKGLNLISLVAANIAIVALKKEIPHFLE